MTALIAIVREQEVDRIVVGLPVSLDGQEHGQAALVREFAAALEGACPVPLVFHDERFSTVMAANLKRESGPRQRRPKSKQRLDAVAAAVILQGYLDAQRGESSSLLPPETE